MEIRRLFKFWITSASGTVVDMGILFLLSRYLFQKEFLIYFLAPVISFEFAMFNNFNISYFWVWKDRDLCSFLSYLIKLLKYNLTCTVAFGVKMVVLTLAKELFHWDVLFCNLAWLSVSFTINYLGGDKFVFRKTNKTFRNF